MPDLCQRRSELGHGLNFKTMGEKFALVENRRCKFGTLELLKYKRVVRRSENCLRHI